MSRNPANGPVSIRPRRVSSRSRLLLTCIAGLATCSQFSGCATTPTNPSLFGKRPDASIQQTLIGNKEVNSRTSPAGSLARNLRDQSNPVSSNPVSSGLSSALNPTSPTSTQATTSRVASSSPASSAVVPVSYTEPASVRPSVAESQPNETLAPVEPAGFSRLAGCSTGNCNNGAGASYCAPQTGCVIPDAAAAPTYWNDQEYLYDGGDRDPRVQVDAEWKVKGLDSQDTVAHYETIDGKLCITPSNRVPIYAPRFGAVRKISGLNLAARAVGAERILEPNGPAVQRTNDLAVNVAQPVGPYRRDGVKLLDAFHDRTRGVGAEALTPISGMSNLTQAFQNIENLKAALQREDQVAVLGKYLQNARAWVNPESLAIMLEGKQAVQLKDAKQPQDVHIYEMEPGKCSLRICKAASHALASPGDIIQFVIRFENVGTKPIGNLVILDSLTTRLEYIDGSQQCVLSVAATKGSSNEEGKVQFSTAENEAGSTVLRWEADSALATGDSGVISFRCRVR